jgi:hypothetical protein
MVGGLGDGSHGLHARKSRAALDQARAGETEAPRTRTEIVFEVLFLLQQVSVSYKGNICFEHATHPLDVFGPLAQVELAAQRSDADKCLIGNYCVDMTL